MTLGLSVGIQVTQVFCKAKHSTGSQDTCCHRCLTNENDHDLVKPVSKKVI